jgi:hypothetical protein
MIPLGTNVSFSALGVSITVSDRDHSIVIMVILAWLVAAWFIQRDDEVGIHQSKNILRVCVRPIVTRACTS